MNSLKPVVAGHPDPDVDNCRLCGQYGPLSKTHVPPQCAGNTGAITQRWKIIQKGGRARDGKAQDGGIWCFGLCGDCNSHAGQNGDDDYCHMAKALRNASLSLPGVRGAPTSKHFKPAGVARSMLYGAVALAPQLRNRYPALMSDLLTKLPNTFKMPADLSLRVAQVRGRNAMTMGPIGYLGVIPPAVSGALDAVVFFPPIAWSLVPADELGEFVSWHDITHWTNTTGLESADQVYPMMPVTRSSLLEHHMRLASREVTVIRYGAIGGKPK